MDLQEDLPMENGQDFEDNDDDDDVQISTPAEVLEMMEEAWVNEKFAPEILPHKYHIVDCLLGQINHMEENVERLDNKDFKKSIHQLEVERIRFIVTSYLRTRLEKIEHFAFDILKREQERIESGEETYLTDNEFQFAKNYKQAIEQHFDNVVNFCPGLPLDWKEHPIQPNLHSFIFAKAKEPIEGVVVDDGAGDNNSDLIDLNADTQLIISYYSVGNLVKNEKMKLI